MDNGAIREGEPPDQHAPWPDSGGTSVPARDQAPAPPSGCIPWVCGLFCILSWLAVLVMLGSGAIAGIIVWWAHRAGDVILWFSFPFFAAIVAGTALGFGFALIATLGAFTLRMGETVRLWSAIALAIHVVCLGGIKTFFYWMSR